jgi:hypothetical protein
MTMNRFFRRMERFSKRFSAKRSQGLMQNQESRIGAARTPQEVTSVRAKSSRHRKSTADKWNQ